ncbi:MAG: AmmeMemoRadiSam system protein B [Candidatus Heimdallarchaeota archaeon]|nr:AmmeMemoRadiSam system protein B [Candidatus Heimdallarchaeota archaeon]
MTRRSPISGSWYPGTAESLNKQMEKLYLDDRFGVGSIPNGINDANRVVGVLAPHAGYVYSGYTATHSYSALKQQLPSIDVAIIMGPNHTGMGSGISFSAEDWETPYGVVNIDRDILEFSKSFDFGEVDAKIDEMAHIKEHSIEIQLPFLQYLYDDFKFFPICFKDQKNYKVLAEFLKAVVEHFHDKKIAIIASSDFSHERDYELLMEHDQKMMDIISAGEIEKAEKFRSEVRMTMCGYGPVFTLLYLNKLLHNHMVRILSYSNSSQITNNFEKNQYRVGYASFYVPIIQL